MMGDHELTRLLEITMAHRSKLIETISHELARANEDVKRIIELTQHKLSCRVCQAETILAEQEIPPQDKVPF